MCSTTPKTKAASPSVSGPSKIKKPASGSGGVGGTPTALTFDGGQEHVPELTFIIEPRIATDDYIAGANNYHSNCGLQPQQFHSIDHLVTMLAGSTTPLKRIRVVGHASGDDFLIPLFGQSLVPAERHAMKDHLNDFAIGDERGLLGLFGLTPGQYHMAWVMTEILSMIRGSNDSLLDPFKIKTIGSPPTDDLKKFILYCCDYAFINRNFYKKNNGALTANEKAGMLKAYNALITLKSKSIRNTKFGTHTVTDGELQSLRDYLTQRAAADLNLTNSDNRSYSMGTGDVNPFLLGGFAGDSVVAGFRDNLNKVRARFTKDSFIDIRGCRVGQQPDYMRAFQDFFGQDPNKPSITGPLWYQAFAGTNSYSHPANAAAINLLLHTGPHPDDIRAGFANWLKLCRVDDAHIKPWNDVLDGSAVQFAVMEWRKKLPALPVPSPGLSTYLAMSFTDFINKTKDFFNVSTAGMPSASVLTTINEFITTKLTAYAPNLLAVTDGSTDQTKLNNILTALNTINAELGNIASPVPSAPIGYIDLKNYQKKLNDWIDGNTLAPLKTFMGVLKTRINDTGDPGFNYYVLFSGMPVFVFSDHEVVNNHQVNVQNNRLVLLTAFADVAYRAWAQLSWVEKLPAGNLFSTLHPDVFENRRSMMMVELPTGGNSNAAVCPDKGYAARLTQV